MTDDIRPTTRWRVEKEKEAEELAAGRITQDECYMAGLFPDEFLDRTDTVLDAFAAAIAVLPATSDGYPGVMSNIKTIVLALNAINESGGGAWIETGEREALCEYIDTVSVQHGIDIDALAQSQNVTRYELTDEWREW
jgi:hypothetical protein